MNIATVTIAGSAVTIREGTLNIKKRVDDKDTCTFTVVDSTGTLAFSKGQPVSVDDSVLGNLFTGYINKPTATNLYPNATNLWSMDCVNKFYVAAKKSTANTTKKKHRGGKHKNQQSGAIVANQIQEFLEPDGVTGNFGLDWSELQTDWQTGAQSGVVAATNTSTGNEGAGDLELIPGGALYTSAPASGTISTVTALAFSGTASSVTATPIVSRQIWSGSIAGGSTDTITYSVWVSSTSPQIVACVDFVCSDGTTFAGAGLIDTERVDVAPTTDLSGLANDQWYARSITTPGFSGKTIVSANLVLAGTQAGNYNFYVQNIKYNSTNIFTSTLNTNTPLSNVGYSNVTLSVVQVASSPSQQIVFTPTGYSGVTLVQGSQVSWVQTVPSGSSILVESSVDNQATWQAPTSGNAVPNLLAGVQISLVNLAYRVTLKVGVNPTNTTLGYSNFVTVIAPSYAMTKTDLTQSYGNAISSAIAFSAGTLTNTQVANNQLTLSGFARNYSGFTGPVNDQTLWGGGGITPQPFVIDKQLQLRSNVAAGNDVRSRMDPAGQWQNFILECDMQVPDNAVGQAGFVYRTTGWQDATNTFAYVIVVTSTTLVFGRGTNTSSGGGGFTSIGSPVTLSLTIGSTHRLKCVINGNSHTFFIDGIQLLSATDTTYPSTGYIGLRVFEVTNTPASSFFNNFSVRPALSGTWRSAALSIASPTTYGNSVVAWDVDGIPDSSCAITMQSSIDGGSTFQSVTNGGAIPGLVAGQSLSAKTLILLATLTCTTTPTVPILNGVSVFVLQQYSSAGTRSTAPLAWDSATRLNVASGFGTASSGQTYAQIGTGTTALAGNELTIANTTGDVHMHAGSVVAGDTSEIVRFSLSTSTITAGLESRFTDANNFYRFSASTTTLTITKVSAGVPVTLTTATMTLLINTFYWMHFQIIGNALNPIMLNGSVWLDGTTEPTTFSITAVD